MNIDINAIVPLNIIYVPEVAHLQVVGWIVWGTFNYQSYIIYKSLQVNRSLVYSINDVTEVGVEFQFWLQFA